MPDSEPNSLPSNALGVSLIIPCYNESAIIEETIAEVLKVMRSQASSFEVIAVDDGSSDDTAEKLRKLSGENDELSAISMMRNFGQTTAYQTGLDHASGDKVILYSGDLEIPAEEILKVIERLETNDFVNTARSARWGGMHAFKSKLANSILNRISGLSIEDRGSGLKGMSGKIAKSLHLYGEWHRFLPDLASLYTNRIIEFSVPFEDRKAGESSYKGSFKSVSVVLDLATVGFTLLAQRKPYSLLPGRFFGFTGLVIGTIGSAVSLWLILQKLLYAAPLGDRPLFLVSLLLAVLGLIMVMVGTLGELVMQITTRLDRQTSHRIRDYHR